MTSRAVAVILTMVLLAWVRPASAVPFFFSTGDVDGKVGTASRPSSSGKIEIETGDDFVVSGGILNLTGATFQGLLPSASPLSNVSQVVVEIYRVFPKDSNDPPSGNVPDSDELTLRRRARLAGQ
jgi:hypothetical protein